MRFQFQMGIKNYSFFFIYFLGLSAVGILFCIPFNTLGKKNNAIINHLQSEISTIQKILDQNKIIANSQKNELFSIQLKINAIEETKRLLSASEELKNKLLLDLQNELKSLEKLVQESEDILASVLRKELINHKQGNKMAFLLSSNGIGQFNARLNYLGKLRNYRLMQYEKLMKKKLDVEEKVNLYNLGGHELQQIVFAKNAEIEKLQELKKERESLLLTIDTEIKDLLEKIKSRKNQMDELNGIVQKVVNPNTQSPKSKKTKTKKLNLLWPVSSSFVSSSFGKQNHPFIKDIIIENNGINLITASDEVVSSCFDGEVSIVASISGLNYTIIIKNDDYRFVYANVKEVLVKSGDKVAKGQSIAKVALNDENVSELHFEVWFGSAKLDPEDFR